MKGFTLVELLAVIVILAVIALIATPIVLSIINDTKESAVIRSAEMYVGAVENKIMQENMKLGGKLNPKECTVNSDGNVTCDGTYLEIEVNGDKPDSGFITYDRGRVTGIELTFGDRKVVTNTSGELVLEALEQIKTFDEICVYKDNGIMEKTVGAKYECEVKAGTKYNFYVLSLENSSINLIMEKNICEDGTLESEDTHCYVPWINEEDYGDGTYNVGTEKGPVTAMNYLNNATKDWSNIANLNITYNDEGKDFVNFKVTGKARLPYYSEIVATGCVSSSPEWMINYGSYWTFSTVDDPDAVIVVYYVVDSLHQAPLIDIWSDGIGVRPVINIKL